jgi:hypothetical protein
VHRTPLIAVLIVSAGIAGPGSAQTLPSGWSSPSPASYRHDASGLTFGSRLARFDLAMPPEVLDRGAASAISYLGASGSKLTVYVSPGGPPAAPADESEFFDAIAGILQMLPAVEAESVGTFALAEDGRENQGRIATFRFKAQDRVMGTTLIVVAARRHILKLRATYAFADEQKTLVHVGEALSRLLGQDIELITRPAR